ncbi:MAG: DUF835 domain-containing protein [Candidatus Altiarchaeota archaeon]
MLVFNWYTVTSVTSTLSIVTWGFPLFLITTLAYYIEKYTKFKTKWEFLVAATILSLLHSTVKIYDSYTAGNIFPLHEAVAIILLIAGMLIATVTSLNLLKFQKILIGKTRDVVEILATAGVVIPLLAYLGGRIPLLDAWNLAAYNTSIVLLSLVFLIIGKLIRTYIPRHGRLIYLVIIFASMLLPLNMLLSSYNQLSSTTMGLRTMIALVGVMLQSLGNLLLAAAALMLIREAKIRGVHLIPLEPKTFDISPIRYRLKKGFGYLISDVSGREGFEMLKEYVLHKHKGLGIVRTNPDTIREEYGFRTTPLLWMTTAETEHKSVKPTDIERLFFIVKDFISNKGNIILIERLDYLISENGFSKTLNFIHKLDDVIMPSDCILVVSMNLNTLSPEQRSQLSEEFQDLESADSVVLNEPLYEVLNHVFTENMAGRRPSFKKITDNFNITKVTTRKRIRDLENKRLVRVIDDGKFKLLEVTETGRSLMKNPVGPRGW